MPICEFCSKEVEAIKGTSMTGAYCIDCLRLTVHECQQAIRDLKQGQSKRQTVSDDAIDQSFNDALQKLMKGPG